MTKKVSLRALTSEKHHRIELLARSRTVPARSVERAQIILAAAQGQCPTDIARDLGTSRPTVHSWIGRFHLQVPIGLQVQPRAGRPANYPPEQGAGVLVAALSDPLALGLPYPSWTLDRLQDYLNAQGVGMRRSWIDEILLPSHGSPHGRAAWVSWSHRTF